ncbi:methyltransferase domain-containing protein [Polymorphobacter arshaanensis]|uniref:Methyltransferase domain-containing protein n=1 Tax=Glacieibacterium arshaanense TaxID=2511025 RepID=A0A4Y9ERA1_9SPHN|nr:methyltransferase domain-containing protein [Polymorphobacter arshaanensis]TFU05733.1 methyltransferase domain-containing protein [Polymorphobacter arshaanensis]
MKISPLLALLLLTASPLAAAPAANPLAAAVAAPDRPADQVELDAGRKPVEVLGFFGLKPGDRVLDVMAGGGYYTEIMARAVGPKGYVMALEPPQFVKTDKAKAAWASLIERDKNVGLMLMSPQNVALAPSSYDFVLMHLVYHDTYWESAKYDFKRMDPAAFLQVVFNATKPGGIVGVVDHVGATGSDTRATVDKLHRMDPAVIKADFIKAGFVFEGESPVLANPADDHTTLVFGPTIRGKTDRVVYKFRRPKG